MLSNDLPGYAPSEAIPADPATPAVEAPPPRRRWRRWKRIGLTFLALFALLFGWLAITAPLSKSLQPIAAPSLTLLSAEGHPIARRGAVTADPVVVSELPDHVPAAFVSIEDRRFYNHSGIDPWGILRAAWRNFRAGQVVEGGSTITQQLAKLAFLSSDQTAARKLQEVLIAFWLEAWLSKDDILGRYMSSAYFGDNVYGLRAAANHYFSREPEELTVSQAAMLAGLLKAPSRLDPTDNLKGARERAELVVGAMVRDGVLTEEEADELKPAKLKVRKVEEIPTGTYFADWAFPEARAWFEENGGDQTIETTLSSELQRKAWAAIRRAGLGDRQVALVAMRPDGQVVAMIGGRSYDKSSFNRATQARRQPGSTFKLFVYLAALRAGMTPESMIADEPVTIGEWSPENSDETYRGLISLREAFAVSSNVAAVRLQERVGREAVIKAARDLGITSALTSEPSLALGTSGISLLEMTAAYAAVAANRYPVKPRGLPDAQEGWLDRVWSSRRRFASDTSQMLHELLAAAASGGTGRAAALSIPTFGKTGTTQDSRDAIFIGFAGDLVTGVWIGNDDNSSLGSVAGGGLPARIWRDFMTAALGIEPAHRTPVPRVVAPPPPMEDGISITSDIGGVEVGLEFDGNMVTIEAVPPPGQGLPPAAIEIPTVPPPPPQETDAGPPVEE